MAGRCAVPVGDASTPEMVRHCRTPTAYVRETQAVSGLTRKQGVRPGAEPPCSRGTVRSGLQEVQGCKRPKAQI